MQRLKWITVGYVSLMAIWFGLWLTVKDSWWWLVHINRIVPWLFVPVPILLVGLLVARQKRWALLLVMPVGLFAGFYWPYLVPRAVSTPSRSVLKVMTFNVLYSNEEYEAVAQTILTYQPDLVALQEVQPAMMAALQERLRQDYPYSFMNAAKTFGTTAAFSRYPVSEAYAVDLDSYRSPLDLSRPAAVLKVMVDGKPVTFISTHLLAYGLEWVVRDDVWQFPQATDDRVTDQEAQAELLLSESPEAAKIVACDCNSPETAGAYRILGEALTNSVRETGWLVGDLPFEGLKPDTALDHIDFVFYKGPWKAIGTYTVQDSAGSDHKPVLTLLEWQN